MRGKRFHLFLVFALLFPFLFPTPAVANESYSYISDVIQCLGISYRAQSTGDLTKAESEIEMMRMLIHFRNEMQLAANIMRKYVKSNDELIKTSAESYNFFYQSMADNQKEVISYFEDMLNNPQKAVEKPGTQAARFGEISAKSEQLWATFVDTTMMATYSMIDMDENRTENGKVNRLNLTKDERQQLTKKLDTLFGNQIKGGPKAGQKPVIGSAAMLYGMLTAPKWKSSDAK